MNMNANMNMKKTHDTTLRLLLGSAGVLLVGGSALGQNLFLAPLPPPAAQAAAPGTAATAGGNPGGTAEAPQGQGKSNGQAAAVAPQGVTGASLMAPPRLQDVSLMVVIPPEPKKFQLHDKIDIIVNETSQQKSDQKLDTKKQYDLQAKLRQFPSLTALLLKNTLENGIETSPEVGIGSTSDYKSTGGYQRQDKFTARIAATVIDVKPNGLLVVEARKTVQSDKERTEMVLAGICDPKDITKSNTVQSSQLADMSLRVINSGQIKDATEKGVIPTVLEKLFNF